MQKTFDLGDQAELVKVAGALMTFVSDDRLCKTAASSAFSQSLIRQHPPDDRHFGVHLIAMGASENYGFNKNGDWWDRDGLTPNSGSYGHHTFVKYGHFFREHENDDPKKKIGDVSASAYNHPMDRIELMVHGDKTKAEEEYELAKAGKQLSFSMSARVPGDYCSCCNNFAKRSKDYCQHLKKAMTQWIAKYSKFAYAINKKPCFFDISRVRNPADRIAHYLEYITDKDEEMAKAASAGIIFSDVLAQSLGGRILEIPSLGCDSNRRQQILEKLASVETYLGTLVSSPGSVAKDDRYQFTKNCARYAFGPHRVTDAQISVMRKMQPDVFAYYLTKGSSVLPFDIFCAFSTGATLAQVHEDQDYKSAKMKILPHIFSILLATESDPVLEGLFIPSDSIKAAACSYEDPIAGVLSDIEQQCSIDPRYLNHRILSNCADGIGRDEVKSAGSCEPSAKSKNLARAYAFYKIAFHEALEQLHGQEVVDDRVRILLTSQQ